jgi:NADPH-dependent ferric siderophore reductase
MIIPTDFDWHLLVGDATALPAIHRRLEELPPGARVQVIAHAPTPDDQRAMPTRADAQVRWVPSTDGLVSAVRELALPAGEGFVWCAGEAAVMARCATFSPPTNATRAKPRRGGLLEGGCRGTPENLE